MDFEFLPEFPTLDKVPEQFRVLYAKPEGGDTYKIVDTHKGVVDALVGLNKALKSERKSRPAPVDLSALSEYGDEPGKIAESVKAKIKSFEDQIAAGSKINVEKIKADLDQAHRAELTKHTKRSEALQGQLYRLLVDQEATAAIAEARGVPKLLLPFIRNQVKVEESDGNLTAYVVDASGDRRYSVTTGQPLSLRELVAEMKGQQEYGRLFDSEAPAGGGLGPESGKRPTTGPAPVSSVSKIAAGLKKLKKGA